MVKQPRRQLDVVRRINRLPRNPVQSKKSPAPLILVGLVILIGLYLIVPNKNSSLTTTLLPTSTPAVRGVATFPLIENLASIPTGEAQTSLNQIDTDNPETQFAVFAQDLKTGKQATLRPELLFAAASTAKLITAYGYLKEAEAGTKSLQTQLGSYSAEYQLEQMINQSNNDSWDLFNQEISLEKQQQYATELGFQHSSLVDTQISAGDFGLLLTKLYSNKLLNKEHTTQLLSYMQNTNEESLIPASLPQDSVVFHKYGMLDTYAHDAAIIEYQGRSIVLVILTKGGTPDYVERAKLFKTITRTILKQL